MTRTSADFSVDLSAESVFERRPVASLVPAIDVDAFRAGAEGVVAVTSPGTLPMPEIVFSGGARWQVPIQKPLNMPAQHGPGLPQRVDYPAMWVARLRDVLCLPGGIVLTKGGAVLEEVFSSPWAPPFHWHMTPTDEAGRLWRLNKPPGSDFRQVSETAFLLDYQSNGFIGHFYADALSRAWGTLYGRAFLGLDRMVTPLSIVEPFMSPILRTLQIGIVGDGAFDQPVLCHELIVASRGMQIQDYVAPVADMLWNFLGNHFGGDPVKDRPKIYISRRLAPNRRLTNEPDIEAEFARRGYTIVCPETLPIDTQIALFRQARAIAGCSGSNMFNLAFCRPDTEITIIASPRLLHFSEMFLSHDNTGGFRLVTGEEPTDRPGDVHAPWAVDIEKLRRILG